MPGAGVSAATSPINTGPALSTAQVEAIRKHVSEICQSPAFRRSNRCSQFLHFIVEQTLEGKPDELKERIIGAQVFGRPDGFETAGDAIVRVKAGDVRKKLAQYYREYGTSGPLHIEIPTGSYVPKFCWHEDATPVSEQVIQPASGAAPAAPGRGNRRAWWVAACAAAVLAITGLKLSVAPAATGLDHFWEPVVKNPAQPIICTGWPKTFQLSDRVRDVVARIATESAGPTTISLLADDVASLPTYHLSMGTFQTIWEIEHLLDSKKKRVLFRSDADLTLPDLSGHPLIFVGAFTNPWTLRHNSGLRFELQGRLTRSQDSKCIIDRLHPENKWEIPAQTFPWKPQTTDYALVSRVFDPSSHNVLITVAGLNTFGTQAAGEFLTNGNYWTQLARSLPAGWGRKNLQFVLETAVVGSTPGAPKVVASHVWP